VSQSCLAGCTKLRRKTPAASVQLSASSEVSQETVRAGKSSHAVVVVTVRASPQTLAGYRDGGSRACPPWMLHQAGGASHVGRRAGSEFLILEVSDTRWGECVKLKSRPRRETSNEVINFG
jgi:hypothetical protein